MRLAFDPKPRVKTKDCTAQGEGESGGFATVEGGAVLGLAMGARAAEHAGWGAAGVCVVVDQGVFGAASACLRVELLDFGARS